MWLCEMSVLFSFLHNLDDNLLIGDILSSYLFIEDLHSNEVSKMLEKIVRRSE